MSIEASAFSCLSEDKHPSKSLAASFSPLQKSKKDMPNKTAQVKKNDDAFHGKSPAHGKIV